MKKLMTKTAPTPEELARRDIRTKALAHAITARIIAQISTPQKRK